MRRLLAIIIAVAVAGPAMPVVSQSVAAAAGRPAAAGDAVVVAVIDFDFSPYHWDLLASKMPQHLDRDPANDLPLDKPPHTWLPGFPNPKKSFDSYHRFDLSLEEKDAGAPIAGLDGKDTEKWNRVERSTYDMVNYYWMPGTKVIGAIEFGQGKLHGPTTSHGVGVTSVSVGNLHGSCPECLLVFINLDDGDEADAIRWAMEQPWIDVVTNSYGRGLAKVYNGPGTDESAVASERGQTIFFSAGNGVENAFTVTNSTYASSEKGPDWIVTVGAVSPGKDNHYGATATEDHGSYVGAGKPVDVAGLGLKYPSAYRSNMVGETGSAGFSGTSNAAPTIAGMYARALYRARTQMKGPSRTQQNGVIARGAFKCGQKRPDCELRDGRLTAKELRRRLFKGAIHTPAGTTTYAGGNVPPVGEDEFMAEGHGTYFVRESGEKDVWLEEFERIVGPMEGRMDQLERPDGEREWMVVDSYCRQHIWGAWRDGYYLPDVTNLPGPDPRYPIRSSLEQTCPEMMPPP